MLLVKEKCTSEMLTESYAENDWCVRIYEGGILNQVTNLPAVERSNSKHFMVQNFELYYKICNSICFDLVLNLHNA